MKNFYILIVLLSMLTVPIFAAGGSLQIYCEPGVLIYINDRIAGKTISEMNGLFVDDLPPGEIHIKAYKHGYDVYTTTIHITENKISELSIILHRPERTSSHFAGLELHFGGFGLFNVNDVFTKSKYTLGFTPYYEFPFHKHFSAGLECNFIWGQPDSLDRIRYFFNPNIRFHILFTLLPKLNIDILVAGGLSHWPSNTNIPYLTPTYNDQRSGWNIRAMAGATYRFTDRFSMVLHLGYFASSSTSDTIVWITHDMMLISLGPKFHIF